MPDRTTHDLNFSPRGLYIGGEWQESVDGGTDLPPRTIPLFKLESVALGWPDRAITHVQAMSALGQERT